MDKGNIPPTGERPLPESEPGRKWSSGLREKLSNPKVVIGGIITIAALWFIIANNSTVRIHLWVVWVSAQLWLVLLLTFIAGALVGYLFARRRAKR